LRPDAVLLRLRCLSRALPRADFKPGQAVRGV
jgi:hypothetical protein